MGKWSNLPLIFSDGLVQPPTRTHLQFHAASRFVAHVVYHTCGFQRRDLPRRAPRSFGASGEPVTLALEDSFPFLERPICPVDILVSGEGNVRIIMLGKIWLKNTSMCRCFESPTKKPKLKLLRYIIHLWSHVSVQRWEIPIKFLHLQTFLTSHRPRQFFRPLSQLSQLNELLGQMVCRYPCHSQTSRRCWPKAMRVCNDFYT